MNWIYCSFKNMVKDAMNFIVANFKDSNRYGNDGDAMYEQGYQMGYEAGVDDTKEERYKVMSREYDNGRDLGYKEGY